MIEKSFTSEQSINNNAYGEEWSSEWNDLFGTRYNTSETVKFLADLAKGGDVLEFGVGTGRVAIPLSNFVSTIHGIDSSKGMLDQYKKNSKSNIKVELCDMSNFKSNKKFDLAYCVSGTILACLTYTDQLKVLTSAYAALKPGGKFVLELFSPVGFPVIDGRVRAVKIDDGLVILSAVTADLNSQKMRQSFIFIKDKESPRVRTTASRFIYPEELKQMATTAGFVLDSIYSNWIGNKFTDTSASSIVVLTKPNLN